MRDKALRVATLVLAAGSIAVLVRLVLRVTTLAPLDANEGWNAYHASAALSGGALYPDAGTLYFNNYPPISFHVVAWIVPIVGDPIAAGRSISLLSLAWLSLATAIAARGLGTSREHAAFAGAFLAAVFLTYSHYVGIADPQLFGHAIAATGLALVLRHPTSMLAAAAGAALCAAALFIKHNLVVMPLALLVWLAIVQPRSAVAYFCAGVTSAVVLLASTVALYGSGFLNHLLSPRTYSIDELWGGSGKWLLKAAWFFVPLAWLPAIRRRDPAATFCAIYAVVAVTSGIYFIGGAGVDQNVFFDAYIAAALSSAVVLERARSHAVVAWYLAPLAISLAVQFESNWLQLQWWSAPSRDASRDFAESIAFVSSRGDTAVCVEQSLCFRAGMPPAVDFFNFSQHVAKGARDERQLLQRIEAREFATVQLAVAPGDETSLGAALRSGYVLARRDGSGVYYVRR
jgi:hypothetical protein